MIQKDNQFALPPELQNVVDEYDRAHNDDVLTDYVELFEILRQIHEIHPDWRFGQIITNLASFAGTTTPGTAYDVPDERLLKTARDYLRRHHGGTPPRT
jgi:hypothetical protein